MKGSGVLQYEILLLHCLCSNVAFTVTGHIFWGLASKLRATFRWEAGPGHSFDIDEADSILTH